MGIAKTAKRGLLGASRLSGASSLLMRSRWRRNRLMILAYHGVSLKDEHIWNPALFVSPSQLRRRFELLRDLGCVVLPLDEALVRLEGGDLPPRAVTLTFDDGNHDFAAQALPMLQDFGYPATVYLTTYYCEKGSTVFDVACRYLAWRSIGRTVDHRELLGDAEPTHLSDRGEADRLATRIRAAATESGLSSDEKEQILAAPRGFGTDEYQRLCDHRLLYIMSPDEVAGVARRGVGVELHTHRHRTPADRAPFEREILDNREVIQRLTGRSPSHFCYPSGDYRAEYLAWLPELNVASATTCEPDLAAPGDDPFLLPRFVDSGTVGEDEFRGWLSGVAALLPRNRRWRRGARLDISA